MRDMPWVKTLLLLLGVASIVSVALVSVSGGTASDGAGQQEFVATDEWQDVAEGQAVPPGLHVKMDLQTGRKQARLMQTDDHEKQKARQQNSALVLVPDAEEGDSGQANGDEHGDGGVGSRSFHNVESGEESTTTAAVDVEGLLASGMVNPDGTVDIGMMKDTLFSLPEPDPDIEDARRRGISEEQLEEIVRKVWARRQAELQEAMASVKSDAQFMQELLVGLLDPSSVSGSEGSDPRPEILEDLEFHVGKVDNAVDFEHMGGLAAVVPLLNDTNPLVRANAAWVLGTVVKLNTGLQTAALELGAPWVLLRAMRNEIQADDGTSPMNPKVVSKQLYALGSLVRQSSVSKESTFAAGPSGGGGAADVLLSVLRKYSDVGASARWQRPVMKALVLLGDLAHDEEQLASDSADLSAQDAASGPSIVIHGGDSLGDSGGFSVRNHLADADLCTGILDAVSAAASSTDFHTPDVAEKLATSLARIRFVCGSSGLWGSSSDRVHKVVSSVQESLRLHKDSLPSHQQLSASLAPLLER